MTAPFDVVMNEADGSANRVLMLQAMMALKKVADGLETAARSLGVTIAFEDPRSPCKRRSTPILMRIAATSSQVWSSRRRRVEKAGRPRATRRSSMLRCPTRPTRWRRTPSRADTGSDSWLEDPGEAFSGGAATVFDTGSKAFSQAVPTLTPDHEDEFFVGNAIFNRGWIIAPASVTGMDGLGPVFNATNCSACHIRDGRGRPPDWPDENFSSMLLRLSVPGADPRGGPLPEPNYGGQLQGASIPGVPGEGRGRVAYQEVPGAFADGEPYSLRNRATPWRAWATARWPPT